MIESTRVGVDQAQPTSTLVGRLDRQLLLTPDATALDDGTIRWSYREMHGRAQAVSERLASEGMQPGDAVGIHLPRSANAIAAIIGVLIAGGAYVPLDPTYPRRRLETMCACAGVGIVIGSDDSRRLSRRDAITIDDAEIAAVPLNLARVDRRREPGLSSPAYILFTSGSTGAPKGVRVSHRSLATFFDWLLSEFAPSEFEATATSTSLSFDPSLIEVFGALASGGTVNVIASALELADRSAPITLLVSTPVVVNELLRSGRLAPSLRTLLVGGERLPPSLARDLLRQTSITRLVNAYGPTETTVMVTSHDVSLPIDGPIPIGREIAGTRIVLVDEQLLPVVDGAVGEICVIGSQVSDEYVGEPELTRERFVTLRDDVTGPVRAYRSGDLARRCGDGVLEFCGRRDAQIKIRGFRVEPAEIEAALCCVPGVVQAHVVAAGQGARAQLVGYLVCGRSRPSFEEVRRSLRQELPDFMVPAELMVLDALPLSAHGKIADDALPKCQHPRAAVERGAELTDVGHCVASLAREVLGFDDDIRGTDDFLDDLGGSSLSLMHLVSLVEEKFSCRLQIASVVRDTSIQGLAALVEPGRVAPGPSSPPTYLAVNETGASAPLFLLHAYVGGVLKYRRLGRLLPTEQPLFGICPLDLEDDSPDPMSIESMATSAIDQIRSISPHGPYLLGGHSAGGLIAYEVARRLRAAGEVVPTVLLIDTPAVVSRLRYIWAEALLNLPELREAVVAHRWSQIAWIVKSRVRFRTPPTASDDAETSVRRAARKSNVAVMRHRPLRYEGHVTVLRTDQGRRMAGGGESLGWSRLVDGGVTCRHLDGGHTTMFEAAHLGSLARQVTEVLEAELAGSRSEVRVNGRGEIGERRPVPGVRAHRDERALVHPVHDEVLE